LIRLKDRYQTADETQFKIDISRNDLASMVGTASESVIRTLAGFKEEKLIRVDGKDIVVLNKQGLEKIW
jgi:CRP-like cAMP-binding protein